MNRALRAPNTIKVPIPRAREVTHETRTFRRKPNHIGADTDRKPESTLGEGRSRIAT
jgi:hypothetical protein